jgi:hypothetical protein
MGLHALLGDDMDARRMAQERQRESVRPAGPRGPAPGQGAGVSASVFFFAAVVLLWIMALMDGGEL